MIAGGAFTEHVLAGHAGRKLWFCWHLHVAERVGEERYGQGGATLWLSTTAMCVTLSTTEAACVDMSHVTRAFVFEAGLAFYVT